MALRRPRYLTGHRIQGHSNEAPSVNVSGDGCTRVAPFIVRHSFIEAKVLDVDAEHVDRSMRG